MTPLLWPVWWEAIRGSLSSTSTREPGWRRRLSRATARPRMPAPTTTRSAWSALSESPAFPRIVEIFCGSVILRLVSGLVLVTGGAGYVGSIVVDELLAREYRVRVLDALVHGGVPSLLLPWGNPNFEFVRGDVRDADLLTSALEDVDAVIHLAA